MVWAVTYFHCYLYGRNVTVFTDLYGHNVTVFTYHLAVKAVQETPNPSSKHTTRVFGSGVNSVEMKY